MYLILTAVLPDWNCSNFKCTLYSQIFPTFIHSNFPRGLYYKYFKGIFLQVINSTILVQQRDQAEKSRSALLNGTTVGKAFLH